MRPERGLLIWSLVGLKAPEQAWIPAHFGMTTKKWWSFSHILSQADEAPTSSREKPLNVVQRHPQTEIPAWHGPECKHTRSADTHSCSAVLLEQGGFTSLGL